MRLIMITGHFYVACRFLDIQTALSLNCGTTVQYCGVETGWSPNHVSTSVPFFAGNPD